MGNLCVHVVMQIDHTHAVVLRNKKGQRILRQTLLPLRYPVHTQRLSHTNQADPRRPMFEHERSNATQQLPQLLEPHLRIFVYVLELTFTEHELLDRGEGPALVKGVMNVWSLGEVQLGVRLRPVQVSSVVGLDLDEVCLRHPR